MPDHRRFRQPAYWGSMLANALRGLLDRLAPTRYGRHFRAVRPYTMMSPARLRALHRAVQEVISRGVPGDLVECGTARGGSAAMMGLSLHPRWQGRQLWVFDTFDGLPSPSERDPDYEAARAYVGACRGDQEDVSGLFDRLELAPHVRLVKGLFQDTLPRTDTGALSVLHIDGDWYDSVWACLQHLYDRVSPGGIVQIDDYGYWEGARQAVEDYFASRGGTPPLRVIDHAGRQFVKP